jgi:hypothetical protein
MELLTHLTFLNFVEGLQWQLGLPIIVPTILTDYTLDEVLNYQVQRRDPRQVSI